MLLPTTSAGPEPPLFEGAKHADVGQALEAAATQDQCKRRWVTLMPSLVGVHSRPLWGARIVRRLA